MVGVGICKAAATIRVLLRRDFLEKSDVMQGICFNPIDLCRAARAYFSPTARWDILDRLLSYFDHTRPNLWPARALAGIFPTAPALTSFAT